MGPGVWAGWVCEVGCLLFVVLLRLTQRFELEEWKWTCEPHLLELLFFTKETKLLVKLCSAILQGVLRLSPFST